MMNELKNFFSRLGFGMTEVESDKNKKNEAVGQNATSTTDNASAANATEQKAEATDGKAEATGRKTEAPAKARIYNLIIVDESGSMSHLRQATLSGVNETIGTIREAQKEFGDKQQHYLTLVTFDSHSYRDDVRTIIDCKPIDEVGEFTDYSPCGGTPLYDAMGESLTALRKRIENDVDASAVVTVLTDGLENASHQWRTDTLRHLIEQLKEEGWSFSYMGSAHNVKEVTDLLAIDNVVEFSHDRMGTSSTWDRERSSRRAYYQKMNRMYSEERAEMDREAMIRRKKQMASEYYGDRVTPNRIETLQPNEIFVFGSNAAGMHGGGAAAQAMSKFGAVWGQGEGLQGQSYAIPTMEGIDNMREAIQRFIDFADSHPDMRFLVTRVGCGIAGYTDRDVAQMFRPCIKLENVALPESFWRFLGLNMRL